MKLPFLILALSLVFPVFAQAGQDDTFLIARDAYKASDRNKLNRAIEQLDGYELKPYAENYLLRMDMDKGDSAALNDFFQRNEKTYVAEKLREEWIRWLGKREMWSEVEQAFAKMDAPKPDIVCYNQLARHARNDRSVFDEAKTTWLTDLQPTTPCKAIFDLLVASQQLTADDVWQRARLQIETKRLGPAKISYEYLPESQALNSRAFDSMINSPMGYLVKQSGSWPNSRGGRELAAIAIQRIAMNDPFAAVEELIKSKNKLHDDERQWAWGQVGLQAAKRHIPNATEWYANAGRTPLSEDGYQWKVRAALRNQEWGVVRDTILSMPASLAELPEWIYWLGRAQRAGGRTTDANALFEKIAGQANFYGNLADEELGRVVAPPPKADEPTPEERQQARNNPGFQRAFAFFRLDMRLEGVREWVWSIRGMDDRQLLAAANLAKQNGIWDRAINTADKTKSEHDYSLRFLSPYGEQVRPAAREQSLDDAWVYGLMRQESRFITSAKSSVGASGLMQLMPATAKWVAKKIGLKNYDHRNVNDTETNVLLGTSYMRMVMENLDNHAVLASAAYNAGPGRAKRWRADQPLEGAIYAESIPFNETRDYVKKVMSNAVYYSVLFNGKPDSLKSRLGVVGPKSTEAMKDKDLP